MKTRSWITLSLLAAATAATALVQPDNGAVLPDFDIRLTGKVSELTAAAGSNPIDVASRDAALLRLKGAVGPDLIVRWNGAGTAPRMLFHYQHPITAPDWRDAGAIAKSFLQDYADLFGFTPAAIDAFVETRRMKTGNSNLTVLHLEQAASGLDILHGEARFAITRAGEIAMVSFGDALTSLAGLQLSAQIDPAEALMKAATAVGIDLTTIPSRLNPASEQIARFELGPFLSEPSVEPVIFPVAGAGRTAYRANLQTPGYPAYYQVIVDAADGRLLHRSNLTKYVDTRGLVFYEHPVADGVPTLRQFFDDTVLTDPRWPLGWAASDRTIGNVVDAKEDWLGDDETTIGQRAFDVAPGPPYVLDSAWTNAYETTGNPGGSDRFFAITQVFYWANTYHDWMYGFGFDESAANWQNDNYGRGGKGGDRLFADIQDGWSIGSRNNANMQTPPDGVNPRAQFFLFTAAIGARRDSDVDGDIVIHEFTHGLSNRLIGGGSGSCLFGFQGGSMGEGWSDYYALAYYDNPILGEYGTGDVTNGIRSHPYNLYPTCHNFNVGEFCAPNACAGLCQPPFCPDDCEVHDEGQLWAATLWEMTDLLRAAIPGQAGIDHALQLVTDGMKLSPCGPTFLDARDGILLADRYDDGGLHQCLIWEAFADRKMGWSATSTGVDDKGPVGDASDPPFCLTQGDVVLNLDSYGCTDNLIATVHDRNATAPIQVQLTSTMTGDSLMVSLNGVAPTFSSAPVAVEIGTAMADARLQIQAGDTITARYTDASPSAMVMTTAVVDCLMNVEVSLNMTGGCSPDGSTWPTAISQILDAGEIINLEVLVKNREPRALTNVSIAVATSNPQVVSLNSAPVTVSSIAPYTGTGVAAIQLAASRFLTTGTVDLDVFVTADGFTGTQTAVRRTVAVHSDYMIVAGTSGIQDFEANDGGYTSYPWPGSPGLNEWRYGSGCGGASGTNSWYAGPISCAGNAAEQDANAESPLFNPTGATRAAWYPTELRFNHRMALGGQDLVVIGLAEPNFLAGGSFTYGLLDSTANTATFAPVSIPFTAADTLGAGFKNELGLVWWFDFFTTNGATLSQRWAIDDVELRYQAADAIPQPGAGTCVQAGYVGNLTSCAGTYTVTAYNTARPAEVQFAGNGSFEEVAPAWSLFDAEFPTASAVNDRVALVVQSNPDNGAHQGVMAVNGQTVASTVYHNFGMSTCRNIPTPIGPAATVAAAQPIMLSWTPYVESGTTPILLGYEVYRVDAETYPQAVSTIDDYVVRGVRVGTTVGSADINRFVDSIPTIITGPVDEYSYALRPVFRCEGVACTPLLASFGGSETTPGKANLSTDNLVFDGVSIIPGTVKVSEGLLANYLSYSARRDGASVKVEWMTAMELSTIGYRVYRGTTRDENTMVRVGNRTVTAQGPGFPYVFEDENAPSGTAYYQIREVASSGAATRTPVIEVLNSSPSGGRGSGRSRGTTRSDRGLKSTSGETGRARGR